MKVGQTLVVLCLFLGVSLYAEPSVYGNSNSFASPQKTINQNKKMIMLLKRQVSEQTEQIDGLKSIVEGLSATVHELEQTVQTQSIKNTNTQDNTLLHDLGEMIDKINANYVTKDELAQAIEEKSIVPQKQTESTTVSSNTPAEAYSEGVRLFVKHRYDEAKKRFKLTDSKGYKTAPSNYYLGEISYYTKKYEDAIFYYKKSAGLNDKASYIDTLLLHTAISLEKRGENEQAKIFYENIIANYDGKKTAEIAKEKLKKL
jgi:TolA-binding protein